MGWHNHNCDTHNCSRCQECADMDVFVEQNIYNLETYGWQRPQMMPRCEDCIAYDMGEGEELGGPKLKPREVEYETQF